MGCRCHRQKHEAGPTASTFYLVFLSRPCFQHILLADREFVRIISVPARVLGILMGVRKMLDMVAGLAADVSVLFLWCLWSCWDGVSFAGGIFFFSAFTASYQLCLGPHGCLSHQGTLLLPAIAPTSLPWDTFPTALSHAFQILISGIFEGV